MKDRVFASCKCHRCGGFLRITEGVFDMAAEHEAIECSFFDEADFDDILASVPENAWLDPPLSRAAFVAQLEARMVSQ